MFITFAVFAILSLISLLIFFVEHRDHQRSLRRYSSEKASSLEDKLQPIMITTIKGGELHETYYYIVREEEQHPKYFGQKIEDSLLKSLLMRTQMCVN